MQRIVDCYVCPIKYGLPLNPVVADDGHVYERKHIEAHLSTKAKSPVTNMEMSTRLVPAFHVSNVLTALVDSGVSDERLEEWKAGKKIDSQIEVLECEIEAMKAALALTDAQIAGEDAEKAYVQAETEYDEASRKLAAAKENRNAKCKKRKAVAESIKAAERAKDDADKRLKTKQAKVEETGGL